MGLPTYRNITHNGLTYVVGSILFKDNLVEFIIDASDVSIINQYPWHYSSDTLATTVTGATGKRELYMHTLLMSPVPDQIVQHISGNGLDNRRCNLRCVDKAVAKVSHMTKKKRNVELPALCGLDPDAIPMHIWYVQANGYHRDRFAIEFKTEKVLWKSTSSKTISLQEKLEHAVKKLKELYLKYPHLDPAREQELVCALQEEFDAILASNQIAGTSPHSHTTSGGVGHVL